MSANFWRVRELEGQVKELQARINEKNQMASDMRDHVDKLDARIKELEAQIAEAPEKSCDSSGALTVKGREARG